jgi:RNA recognition motif-containing protein
MYNHHPLIALVQHVGLEDIDSTEATILETSRLFVRNLTFSCTEQELQELFSKYGHVSQVRTLHSILAFFFAPSWCADSYDDKYHRDIRLFREVAEFFGK